jgi:hypothetical protein
MLFDLDVDGDGQLDHPLLYYLWFVLIGINMLDIITTRYALLNPINMEGNPFMAPFISYAWIIKLIYITGALWVCDYLEHKNGHRYGIMVMSLICGISFMIVANNILILNGIYLFG